MKLNKLEQLEDKVGQHIIAAKLARSEDDVLKAKEFFILDIEKYIKDHPEIKDGLLRLEEVGKRGDWRNKETLYNIEKIYNRVHDRLQKEE